MLNLREIGDFLARLQPHVRLFPVGPESHEPPAAPHLTLEIGSTHFLDLYLEKLFDRRFHLGLGGLLRVFETQGALVVLLRHALFGHQRAAEHIILVHFASASENLRAAASESRTFSCPSR